METITVHGHKLTHRQAHAVRLASETHGVSTNGNTVKALVRRGLAHDRGTGGAFGGGTTIRLTDEGRRVGEELGRRRLP